MPLFNSLTLLNHLSIDIPLYFNTVPCKPYELQIFNHTLTMLANDAKLQVYIDKNRRYFIQMDT